MIDKPKRMTTNVNIQTTDRNKGETKMEQTDNQFIYIQLGAKKWIYRYKYEETLQEMLYNIKEPAIKT